GVENGVTDGRRQRDNRALARTRRRQVPAVEEDRFERRDVAEARHAVAREARVEDLPVRKFDGLKQRPADALYDRPLDLILQAVGVDYGAALEGCHDAHDLHLAARPISRDFGAGRDVTALLESARDPAPMTRRGF